ncbi:hypothetical protein QE152_g39483 [Popillia japonica]|uniref:Uncharacterized protein n=1 Tax=Popillia japonica TaxID=7064 RepID=A0AAW1HTY9_POPJA
MRVASDDEFLTSFVTDRPIITTDATPPPEDESAGEETAILVDLQHGHSIPGTSSAAQNLLTPELIRPFPKAQARKGGKRGGRKPCRCRILRGTPEECEHGHSIPGTSSAAQNLLTPELIRPFPKAQARKGGKRGGRKPGRCRILRGTPEECEIEQQAAIR